MGPGTIFSISTAYWRLFYLLEQTLQSVCECYWGQTLTCSLTPKEHLCLTSVFNNDTTKCWQKTQFKEIIDWKSDTFVIIYLLLWHFMDVNDVRGLSHPDLIMKMYLWELFLQDAKYVVCFMTYSMWKCPLSDSKRVFGIFSLEQVNIHMVRFIWCWFWTRHRSSDLKCPLSGTITLMLHDVLK